MEIRLNDSEINAIAYRVADYLRKWNCVLVEKESDDEWITAEEAAKFLKISKSRIYHIKNHLTHRKGNSRQSRVLFKKSNLQDDYMNI